MTWVDDLPGAAMYTLHFQKGLQGVVFLAANYCISSAARLSINFATVLSYLMPFCMFCMFGRLNMYANDQ
jgi:hypothetical protein